MGRRIVFAGGVQTRALARLYRGTVADETGDDVVFIGSGALGSEAARSAMLLADVLAAEIDEDGDSVPTSDVPTQATFVRVPNLYADYLWPFAGRSHPKNRGQFALPGGPYPAEHGDRFLDQMVEEGVDEDEAIRRYLALDIAREGELDSRLEDRLNIQRRLDGLSGFDVADFIADNFRVRQLFRTRQRLTLKLLRRMMRQLLPKLGVRGFSTDRITQVPFPAGAQPVHPGVAAHFGLRWVAPGQRYPMNDEGYFTFEQYCRRYMRFSWNEPLHRGIQAAKTQAEGGLALLEQGLAVSPESVLGRRARLIVRHARGLDAIPPAEGLLDEESYDPEQEPAPPGRAKPPATATKDSTSNTQLTSGGMPETIESAVALAEADGAGTPLETSSADAEVVTDLRETPPKGHEAAEPEEKARVRFGAPSRPVGLEVPDPGVRTTEDGFTDFGPPGGTQDAAPPPSRPEEPQHGFTDFGAPAPVQRTFHEPAPIDVSIDLIEALPGLLPVFTDLSAAADRPFATMPEIMPPPPLRPILPPELQNEPPRQGLFSRILGRRSQ